MTALYQKKTDWPQIFLGSAITGISIGIALIVLFFYVEDLRSERDLLSFKNDQLKNDTSVLTDKNTLLESQIATMIRKEPLIFELTFEVRSLKEQKEFLQSSVNELIKEVDTLTTDNDSLQSSVNELIKEVDTLTTDNDSLQSSIGILTNQIENLKEDKQKFTDRLVNMVIEGKLTKSDVIILLPKEGHKVIEDIMPSLSFPVDVNDSFSPGFGGDAARGKDYFNFTKSDEEIRISYKPGPDRQAEIYWQDPEGNWGDQRGHILIGAEKLIFSARGETGEEVVEFKTGGIQGKKYEDSFEKSLGRIQLLQDWKQYEILLDDQDLSIVIGAFVCIISADDNPNGVIFYLKDIYFEKE